MVSMLRSSVFSSLKSTLFSLKNTQNSSIFKVVWDINETNLVRNRLSQIAQNKIKLTLAFTEYSAILLSIPENAFPLYNEARKIIVNPSLFSPEMLGFLGEKFAASYFLGLGFKVSIPLDYHYGDLVLNDSVFIEVKTITRNKDHTFAATIRKQGSQSITNVDYIILYIIDDKIYTYIIPTSFVPTIKRIHITSHPKTYAGKYLQFLNNWTPLLNYAKNAANMAKIPA